MILYYIEYTDEQDVYRVEAFKSRATARKRVSEMSQTYKKRKSEWQEWVITRRNKPKLKPVEPPEVREAAFDLNSEGILSAFTYLSRRGK